MAQTPKPSSNKPAHAIRVGKIRAAIWVNTNERGPWYTVTFGRLYKEGDKWSESGNFNMADLPALAQVASMACFWIHSQNSEQQETEE
jgi:hypothetical protein